MFTCDVGDIPQIKNVFTDASTGATVDPTEVFFYLRRPDGIVGTYTYTSGSVVRLSQGTYYYNGTATMPGYWDARWQGSGAAVAAEQARYFVRGTIT